MACWPSLGLRRGEPRQETPNRSGQCQKPIVERTIDHLTPTVKAMVRLQLASAMRPGEVCLMRASDLNMSGPIWEYRPETHKTEHHEGAFRVIMLGPKSQEIIRRFLRLNVGGYLFSPRQSEAEAQRQLRREERKTPLWPSHVRHQAGQECEAAGP